MPPRRKIPADVQEQIRQRAYYLCEYCHTAEQWQYVKFTIDHVIPIVQGGADTPDNLALSCFHCNRRKSNKIAALDPETGEMVPLFNPRQQRWAENFAWSEDGLFVLGLTPGARATIALLELNRERVIHIRAADVAIGRHPPEGDPILLDR